MTDLNYPILVIFGLITLCFIIWVIRINQNDRNSLRKMLRGHKLHRKHLKKNKLH